MTDGPVLGIDLGTTNSVVAVADGGQARVLADAEGRRMMPSVVSFAPEGDTLVGYEARERRLVDAANTVYAVKRLIGRPFSSPEVARARERLAFEIVPNEHGGSVVKVARGTYALAEISAIVLRELRRRAESALGERAERAVITVPANFNELQRSATKAAGKVAGLEVLRILNEPTAAALAYGYGAGQNERVAVYDLGGGTFDITILELEDDVFEVLSTAGDTFLGGEDLDRMIAERMGERFRRAHGVDLARDAQAFDRLKAAAEWAKCALSNEDAIELTVEELAVARGKSLDLTFAMTRAELEALARPWLDRSFEVCGEALAHAGVQASELDSVVLVGGSTRMPLCRQRVASFFGKAPRTDIDPDLVVAQGAAIHGFALGGPRTAHPLRPTPGTPRAAKRMPTDVGVPRQPAFAPDEGSRPLAPRPPRRPARSTSPPPPMPELPIPSPAQAVLVAPAVQVRTPRTTLDMELDALAPPDHDDTDLDALAPAPFDVVESFADLAPDEPFREIASAPLAAAPGQRAVPSREPTVPFAIDRHAPRPALHRGAATPTTDPTLDALLPPSLDVSSEPFATRPAPREPTRPLDPRERRGAPEREPEGSLDGRASTNIDSPRRSPREPAPSLGARAIDPPPPEPARAALPSIVEPAAPRTRERDPVQTFRIDSASPAQPVVPMPERAPPLLMDVTPHSLGLETAGGYCRKIILKNAPVPTEQTRSFTTARDEQREVVVRICQGEHDQFQNNEVLGEIVLDQLPPRRSGALTIDVAFILDADGTLAVEARDRETGRVQRTRISLRGGLSAEEIEAMRARQQEELR